MQTMHRREKSLNLKFIRKSRTKLARLLELLPALRYFMQAIMPSLREL